jgi:CDP-6-deoxy-D-xylo-4-hexulose-3-dehydrase
MTADEIRLRILDLVSSYAEAQWGESTFIPGTTPVPYAGRVFDQAELVSLVDSALDFWLTAGPFSDKFEREFASFHGVGHAMLCNSGSSANLLAVSALTSPKLGERQLQPGDEVITAATGFPTTVNPILQAGLVPVFVDVELPTYNVAPDRLASAIGPRTRAIVLAHTLGNPFDVEAISHTAQEHGLWLVEDNCDAVGSKFAERLTGTFGDLATASFYPAHHLTMGEGGCVLTSQASLRKIVESFRDWGRDCWCAPGADNTCAKRFLWQLGDLPHGYDHKYTYSHIGYNLKATDLQAAVGLAQLQKLPGFIEARKGNWRFLRDGLDDLDQYLVLPEATPRSDPSWFGFAITVRPEAPFNRGDLVRFLDERKIATRMLFAGNLTRQPAYAEVPHRIEGDLKNSDLVMENTLWLGVYPGLSPAMIEYVVDSVRSFVRGTGAKG